MNEVFICDAIRTPVGRYGGALAPVRADDLSAIPMRELMTRNPSVDWSAVDDVVWGAANQAGEDNRNVGRMALLLAGLPETVPGCTINRLCGSGMDAVGTAARAIASGEADFMIAGGGESMSRAPFVMAKPTAAYARAPELFDTTLGWRFPNPELDKTYGTDAMMQTAENLAAQYNIAREAQDHFAFHSQQKSAAAQKDGRLAKEIIAVTIPQRKGDAVVVDRDEHPRESTLEKLSTLRPLLGENATVTAGNASGINDGAAALLLASDDAVKWHGLTPKAKVLGMATAGVPPRIMGIGPVPASQKLLKRLGLSLDDMDVIELNEAFAVQALACLSELGLAADDPRINPLGGAIALGHPLGMSGARLLTTAVYQLQHTNQKRALCTMCIGVGQGIAMVIERV